MLFNVNSECNTHPAESLSACWVAATHRFQSSKWMRTFFQCFKLLYLFPRWCGWLTSWLPLSPHSCQVRLEASCSLHFVQRREAIFCCKSWNSLAFVTCGARLKTQMVLHFALVSSWLNLRVFCHLSCTSTVALASLELEILISTHWLVCTFSLLVSCTAHMHFLFLKAETFVHESSKARLGGTPSKMAKL